jgi:hypothetical protein
MVDQETVGPKTKGARRLGRNLTGFAHDVATLAELQLRLLSVDFRDAVRQAGPGAVVAATAMVVALGALPIALAAIGFVLMELAGWSASLSFGVVAVVSLGGAAGLGYAGWRKLSRATTTLQRSQVELIETVKWIKESLKPSTNSEWNSSPLDQEP